MTLVVIMYIVLPNEQFTQDLVLSNKFALSLFQYLQYCFTYIQMLMFIYLKYTIFLLLSNKCQNKIFNHFFTSLFLPFSVIIFPIHITVRFLQQPWYLYQMVAQITSTTCEEIHFLNRFRMLGFFRHNQIFKQIDRANILYVQEVVPDLKC